MMANQDYTPPDDCIVVQTDFAFDFVNRLITRLYNDQQLQLQSVQEVKVDNIRSNNPNDNLSLVFGNANCFARTASSVLRMCMLRSAEVPEHLYPKLGKPSMRRNKTAMEYSWTYGNKFVLTTNKDRAKEYYSHYDQLYPHMKDELCTARPNQLQIIPGTMMLIFRGNFSEIIAFNTSLQVKYCPNYQNIGGFLKDVSGHYESFAHVVCQVQRIRNPNHACLNVLRLMKGGNWHINTLLRHLPNVLWAEEEITETEPETDDYEKEVEEYFGHVSGDDESKSPPVLTQPQMGMQPPPRVQAQPMGMQPYLPQNLDQQNPGRYGQPQAPQPYPQDDLGEQLARLNIGQLNH